MIKPYEVLGANPQGFHLIKLTEGDFSGIIYSYGKVGFIEEDDMMKLQFEFNVHESSGHDFEGLKSNTDFTTHIGDILTDMIVEQIAKNEVVYTGGVDENRTDDSSESDL
jgi:hypothetical protein